jgi:hypothetical protein
MTTHPPVAMQDLLTSSFPDIGAVTPPDRRVLIAIAVAALAADVALRSGLDGVAGAIVVGVLSLGPMASGRVPNRRAWPLLAVAAVLGLGLATRATEWLLALDVLAAGGLAVLGSSLARAGDPRDLTVAGLVGRGAHALIHGVCAPAFVAAARSARGSTSRRTWAVVRGIALGAPVVLVVAALLGSADGVFASFFHLPTSADEVVAHGVSLALGAWAAAGLLRLSSAAPFDVHHDDRRLLGQVESLTVLSGLVAVFTAFAVAQVATVVGGDDYVRRTAGLSYAEHARSGFFQLLAGAGITLAVLLVLRAAVGAAGRAAVAFVVLAEAAVVLTLVVVAGAVRRLGLYEQAYGLTSLRLCAVLFALWIGAVFVLLGLSFARLAPGRAWLVPAGGALAVAGLLVLTVANPEAFVVRRNVDRFAGTGHLDVAYLTGLSDDAVPAIVDALPGLSREEVAVARAGLCARREKDGGVWSFNLARSRAADALRAVC